MNRYNEQDSSWHGGIEGDLDSYGNIMEHDEESPKKRSFDWFDLVRWFLIIYFFKEYLSAVFS